MPITRKQQPPAHRFDHPGGRRGSFQSGTRLLVCYAISSLIASGCARSETVAQAPVAHTVKGRQAAEQRLTRWTIRVSGMGHVYGKLLTATSGRVSGLLYDADESAVYPLYGKTGPNDAISIFMSVDPKKFHDPGFNGTLSASTIRGSWSSGMTATDGRRYGEGNGSFGARPDTAQRTFAHNLPAFPIVATEAGGSFMRCAVARIGHRTASFTFDPALPYRYRSIVVNGIPTQIVVGHPASAALTADGSLTVNAAAGDVSIELYFPQPLQPTPESIDYLSTPPVQGPDPQSTLRLGMKIERFAGYTESRPRTYDPRLFEIATEASPGSAEIASSEAMPGNKRLIAGWQRFYAAEDVAAFRDGDTTRFVPRDVAATTCSFRLGADIPQPQQNLSPADALKAAAEKLP